MNAHHCSLGVAVLIIFMQMFIKAGFYNNVTPLHIDIGTKFWKFSGGRDILEHWHLLQEW